MIPNTKDRELSSSPIAASGKFGISKNDTAHIMGILRDTLYSDKVLAVLREYSANAWDAHREVDKPTVPIKVTIPTAMKPTLLIRDYGPGLSQDDVFQVYTQYGASTKRTSDKAVGMLGIGSKSGFAYSDSFTITSWHGGMKRIYLAILDKTEEGLINLLHEEECSLQETGIEIQIAVKPNDALEFQSKAQKLFQHFDPRPVINLDLPPEPSEQTKLKNGIIYKDWDEDGNQWTAVMGCIPYRLDLNQVRADNNNGVGVAEYMFRVGGTVKFDIGEVQISASREELKYSDTTKKAMIAKFAALVDEYVEHTFNNINSGIFTFWERRLRAQTISAMKLPIPAEYKHITQSSIEIKHKPKTFKFTVHGGTVNSIAVASDSRVLLRNDKRELAGYHLGYHDYLVEKNDDDAITWDMVKAEVDEMLDKADIDGLPILDINTQHWYTNAKQKKQYDSNKIKNKKHTVSSFILSTTPSFHHPHSGSWLEIDREPKADDVFVVVDKFKVVGYNRVDVWDKSYIFAAVYREDERLIKLLGGTMPAIYGYKTTEKKPVANKDCVGIHYSQWRDKFIKSLLVGKQLKLYEYWLWAEHAMNAGKTTVEKLTKELGPRHAITKYLKKQLDAKRIFTSTKRSKTEDDYEIVKRRFFKDVKPAPVAALDDLLAGYPLLETTGLQTLWGSHADRWIDYVKLVDK